MNERRPNWTGRPAVIANDVSYLPLSAATAGLTKRERGRWMKELGVTTRLSTRITVVAVLKKKNKQINKNNDMNDNLCW